MMEMSNKRLFAYSRSPVAGLLLALLLAALSACDSGNPVVPSTPQPPAQAGQLSISVTVVPTTLLAGGTEPALVTVMVRRVEDNQPPDDGTSVVLSVDQGSLGVNNPQSPAMLQNMVLTAGQAQTSYFPGPQLGAATLLAQVGEATGSARVDLVEILAPDFFLLGAEPAAGLPEGGETVTLQGVGFKQPLRVLFGGLQAPVKAVSNDGRAVQITTPALPVMLDPGAFFPVDITVTNALNEVVPATDTLVGGFVYTESLDPPLPFVIQVSPSTVSADGGSRVRVIGGGFRAPVRVDFGGKAGINPTVRSSSEIRVTTPKSPQPVALGATLPVDVVLTNSLNDEPQVAFLPGGLTYEGGEVPTPVVVSSISPADGPATGGTQVVVSGSGFVAPVSIELGGLRQNSELFILSTAVRFTTLPIVPAQCPAGGVIEVQGVTVTNLTTGDSASAPLTFSYRVPVPTITRVSPSSGTQLGNTVINVDGDGFVEPVRVLFFTADQEFAGVVQSVTSTRVRAATPRLPDSAFPEVDCVTSDGIAGKRFQAVTVGVRLFNLGDGCEDSFPNVFTYNPINTRCRIVATTPAPTGGGG